MNKTFQMPNLLDDNYRCILRTLQFVPNCCFSRFGIIWGNSESVIVSDLEIAIASPSFASLFKFTLGPSIDSLATNNQDCYFCIKSMQLKEQLGQHMQSNKKHKQIRDALEKKLRYYLGIFPKWRTPPPPPPLLGTPYSKKIYRLFCISGP